MIDILRRENWLSIGSIGAGLAKRGLPGSDSSAWRAINPLRRFEIVQEKGGWGALWGTQKNPGIGGGRPPLLFSLVDARTVREFIQQQKAITLVKYGGPEGASHLELKNHVAGHPELLGLPEDAEPFVEYLFATGHRADILFAWAGNFAVVEIEVLGAEPTRIGAQQAVVYRDLLCMEKGLPLRSPKVPAYLVAREIPESTRRVCKRYGIKPVEVRRRQ